MATSREVVLWTLLAVCAILQFAAAQGSPTATGHIHSDNNVQDKAEQPPLMVTHLPEEEEGRSIQHSRLERSPEPQTISSAPASVCDRLCNCSKENEIFINIICDFTKNAKYVLDDQTLLPNVTRTFHVNLGRNAQLYIREKVFRRTILNRISVNGGEAGGRQEVIFGPRAFHDNRAPFPEIDLSNAQTLTIHGNAFHGEFKLNVGSVENVIVQANAFQNTTFIGSFRAVQNLRFEKDAFLGTKDSQIQISDTNIGLLERMDATMQEIKLRNCRIDAIRQNTFDVLSISSIVFENCDIDVIESNFTTGKLLSDYLGIIGCRIGRIQSNAIANSGFSVVQIERNTIENIEPQAISAHAITLSLAHNIIPKTGEGWLKVQEWSNVSIFNNSFGHLDQIDVQGGGQQCQFSRNSIFEWTANSLAKMSPTCQFQVNLFATRCTCNLEWLAKLSRSEDLKRSSYCQIDSELRHCFNASSFNVQNYYETVCSESSNAIDCRKTMNEKKVDANFVDPNDFSGNAQRYGHVIYLLVGIAGLCIVLIVIIIIVIRLRCQKTAGVTRNHPPNNVERIEAFSVADRMIVDQAMDKLREKYPRDVYEQIDKYTKKLIQEPLSETEKVLTIGEIVRLLDECENIGEDFLAFTDILYQHLDGPAFGAPAADGAVRIIDPVYAEPGALMGGEPVMTTIIPSNLDSDNHIYAEPNSAQQPLLKTEYSLPLDRSDHATNVYAEPVEARNDKSSTRLVSPYAIGSQLPLANATSPSSNLPDVLSRSVAVVAAPPIPAPKLNTFGKTPSVTGSAAMPHAMPGTSRAAMPMYSIPQKNTSQVPLQRDNSSSSNSNHSGGSDITFKIDDIIDYADS